MRAAVKCISALAMRFKDRDQRSGARGRGSGTLLPVIPVLAVLIISFAVNKSSAELLDRIVAVVNSQVILYSELQDAVERSRASGAETSESQALQELINRTLILEQALKFRVEMETYNQSEEETRRLIDDYITRRIKAFIHVPFEKIEDYYMAHRDDFGQKDMYEVWDEIENRLRNEWLAVRLDEHISVLRKEAYIRVQLATE